MEKIRASQQHFILVASLVDRIPNLAGLARTCEVCGCLIMTNLYLVYLQCFLMILFRSILFFFLGNHFSWQVFRAAGLAIADTNILHDKQFQLIRF